MNQSTLMNGFVKRLLIVAVLFSGRFLFAGPEAYDTSKEEPPAPLEVRIGLPGFLSSLGGGFGVKGLDLPLDVSVDTLVRHINRVPLALSAYVRYQRWEIFGDGEYIGLGVSSKLPGLLFTNVDLEVKNAFWEGFLGYRLI